MFNIPIPEVDLEEEPDVLYPEVHVQLTGTDGNAGAIMARVADGLRKAKAPHSDISEFRLECLSGDYAHLLYTCTKWVTVS